MTEQIDQWGKPMRRNHLARNLWSRASLLAILFAALGAGYSGGALAQDDDEDERRFEHTETKQRHAVGQACGGVLEDVQEMTEEDEDWRGALEELQGPARDKCATSYERSQVQNFLGYVYYSLERYQDAIQAYTDMLKEEDVDDRQAISTRYTIAQLYLVEEDYENAARQLELWMQESPTVGSDAKVLLAQAYYQMDRIDDSLELVEEAISEYEADGKVPKENWWSLQRVIYYDKNQYPQVVEILKKLIKHYPSFSYWRQLGGMYGELDRDIEQLVATELVYLSGELDEENQVKSLAYLYLGAEAPYRAAKILEKGMDDGIIEENAENLETLGLAWQQARNPEEALPTLERAAGLAGKGKIYERLTGVYLDLDQNKKAVEAARNAIQRGDLRRKDIVNMNMGNALLNLHCYNQAIDVFREAAKDDRSERYAKQWIEYAEKEGDRRKQLIESGAEIAGCQLS